MTRAAALTAHVSTDFNARIAELDAPAMHLYPDEIAVMSKAIGGKAVTAEPGEIRTWRGLCEGGMAYELGGNPRGKFLTFKIGPTGSSLLAIALSRKAMEAGELGQ